MVDLVAQVLTHALVDFLLSQGVVFEGHRGLTRVSFGCEDIVQAVLSRKYILHDVNRLLFIISMREAIQNVCIACQLSLRLGSLEAY